MRHGLRFATVVLLPIALAAVSAPLAVAQTKNGETGALPQSNPLRHGNSSVALDGGPGVGFAPPLHAPRNAKAEATLRLNTDLPPLGLHVARLPNEAELLTPSDRPAPPPRALYDREPDGASLSAMSSAAAHSGVTLMVPVLPLLRNIKPGPAE